MSATILPGKHLTYKWDCDDKLPEEGAFSLQIVQASDGDFHISVVPQKGHPNLDHFLPCCSASLRIRMPMVGGGRHEHLWDALQKVCEKERKAANKANKKSCKRIKLDISYPDKTLY